MCFYMLNLKLGKHGTTIETVNVAATCFHLDCVSPSDSDICVASDNVLFKCTECSRTVSQVLLFLRVNVYLLLCNRNVSVTF